MTLLLSYTIFYHFPLFEETFRHFQYIKLYNSVIMQSRTAKPDKNFLTVQSEEFYTLLHSVQYSQRPLVTCIMKILQWRETVSPTLATSRLLFTEFSSKVGSTLHQRYVHC